MKTNRFPMLLGVIFCMSAALVACESKKTEGSVTPQTIDILQKQIQLVSGDWKKALQEQQIDTQKSISDLRNQMQAQISHLQTEMQQMQTQLTSEIKQVQSQVQTVAEKK